MKKILIFVFLFLITVNCFAEDLYVCASGDGQGSTNGADWDNCFDGLSDVSWGSGAGALGAGDTLYVDGGASSKSYGALNIAGSGTSESRITIKIGQDANHNGTANFASISFVQQDYITIDGEYSGTRKFATTGLVSSGGGGPVETPILKYVTVTRTSGGDTNEANDPAVDMRWSANAEIAYNLFDIRGSLYGVALNLSAPAHSRAYSQASVHHNTIYITGRLNDGSGPDGIHNAFGYDIYNNTIQAFAGSTANTSQHQDLVQSPDGHSKVYNNTFIDSGDSQFDVDNGTGAWQHLYLYNNVFVRTVDTMGTVGFRAYFYTSTNDVRIDNNTFVDAARTGSSYGAAVSLSGSGTVTDATFRNNLLYNCGDTYDAILIQGASDYEDWDSSNNLLNAGSEGNTTIGGSFPNVNGQSGAPSFVSYTPYSLSNDYNLASGDTAAKDNGVDLSAYFTTDKDGNTRSGTWDIGAYEFGTPTNAITGVNIN